MEGLREGMKASVLVELWPQVRKAVKRWPEAISELREVKKKVEGWISASEKAPRGLKYLVNWFAGWPEVMRSAASELGWQVVAVDNREGFGPPHELNIKMELLMIAPQFWRLEAARLLGVSVLRLGPNWFAIPCTTTSRPDPSNRTMNGVEVFNNYRSLEDTFRGPQHGVGTTQGDKARETNRIVACVTWVTEDCNESYGIENPDAAMQYLELMAARVEWMNRLDYCRLWSKEEREMGLLWQKPTCLWTRRKDGEKWKLNSRLKCRRKCACRKGDTREHLGRVELMTEMVERTGRSREELKCRYPKELLVRWLGWVAQAEHNMPCLV